MRMKSLLAVVMVFLGCVCLSEAFPFGTVLRKNTTGCCFPDQFEGDVFAMVDRTVVTISSVSFIPIYGSFDFKDKRVAMKNNEFSVIMDLANRTHFLITRNGKKCTKRRIEHDLADNMQCITKYMDYDGFSYFGSHGDKLMVETFSKETHRRQGKQSMGMTVTDEDCYPVSMVVNGKSFWGLSSLFEVVSWANIKDGIADVSVFDLPDSCKKL